MIRPATAQCPQCREHRPVEHMDTIDKQQRCRFCSYGPEFSALVAAVHRTSRTLRPLAKRCAGTHASHTEEK